MPSSSVTPLGDSPQGKVADLARSGRLSGGGAVSEGVGEAAQPQAHSQNKLKVCTVDGWTEGDQKKPVSRNPSRINHLNSCNSSSASDSYSEGSSEGSTPDTTSGGSIGCGRGWVRSDDSGGGLCCGCLCSKTETALATKPASVDVPVLPGRRPLGVTRRAKCCNALILKEDNARFLLLALVLLLYMVFGALVFEAFEEDTERRERDDYISRYTKSLAQLSKDVTIQNVSLAQVEDLLYIWGNMTDAGHKLEGRRLWDFAGSFFFVCTVVSTIGYGAAAPKTQKGKIFCIFYGLVGCSSGILFFNLFLERIITLLAFIMRRRHERNQRKRMAAIQRAQGVVENGQRRTSQDSMEDGSLSAWKPSVYWVMFYLSIASIIVAFLGAIMFMEVEEWTYENAIYFCFVSFSTIGFGDFVSAQQPNVFYGPALHTYRFFNFIVLGLGCCCIYSLFNVISIIIKQFLNFIIKRTATCCAGGQCTSAGRRNTVSPSRQQKLSIKRLDGDIDSVYGSETERKLSGEMVSMREYISTNKIQVLDLPRIQEQVSLAVMQKQLYETAQLGRGQAAASHQRPPSDERFTPGKVGPLAIASSKLFEGRS